MVEFPVRPKIYVMEKNEKRWSEFRDETVCHGGAIAFEASEMKGEKWQNDVPRSFTVIMRAKIAAYISNDKRIVVELAVYECVCGKRDYVWWKITRKLKWFRETK